MDYLIIVSIFLIIVLLYFVNKKLINISITENFKVIHKAPKENILKNCDANYKKNFPKSNNQLCHNSAFVTDPSLLSGICGGVVNITGKKNKIKHHDLYAVQHGNNIYYGCNNRGNYQLLSWKKNGKDKQFKLSRKVGDNLTLKNVYTSDLILFVVSNTKLSGKLGKQKIEYNSPNKLSTIKLSNVRYNDIMSISLQSGAYCLAYIWNGQLYIMDINGFQSSINTIKSNENFGQTILNNPQTNKITTLPFFMNNWSNISKTPVSNNSLTFNIGVTNNMASFTSSLTIFLVVNGTASVKLGTKEVFKYDNKNKVVSINVDNVMFGDEIVINANSKDVNVKSGTPLLGIAYVYKGYIFVLNNGKDINKVASTISVNSTNWNNKYSNNNENISVPPIITGWLTAKNNNRIYTFKTNIGV